YDLWLRYVAVSEEAKRDGYRRALTAIVVEGDSSTARVVRTELDRALPRLLGRDVPVASAGRPGGALVVGTPTSWRVVAGLGLAARLAALGREGYVIRSARIGGHAATVVASAGDAGTLYRPFHLPRLPHTRPP